MHAPTPRRSSTSAGLRDERPDSERRCAAILTSRRSRKGTPRDPRPRAAIQRCYCRPPVNSPPRSEINDVDLVVRDAAREGDGPAVDAAATDVPAARDCVGHLYLSNSHCCDTSHVPSQGCAVWSNLEAVARIIVVDSRAPASRQGRVEAPGEGGWGREQTHLQKGCVVIVDGRNWTTAMMRMPSEAAGVTALYWKSAQPAS